MRFKAVTLLVVAVALLLSSNMLAMAASVAIVTDPKATPTKYDVDLLARSKDYFTSQGFAVVDEQTKADYVITTSMTSSTDSKFNPLGCLACGIWGATKKEASVNLLATATKDGAQVWTNKCSTSAKGSDLIGTVESTGPIIKKALKSSVPNLYSSFVEQVKQGK
ncbi:MAG: hypothetical protein Q7T82_01915 [Armatimonadota bacterium]|nr:hypothetical protein [Armatimonadota bacterium]